jgi:hypothetical protein
MATLRRTFSVDKFSVVILCVFMPSDKMISIMMLGDVMLGIVMLSGVKLNVSMLSEFIAG